MHRTVAGAIGVEIFRDLKGRKLLGEIILRNKAIILQLQNGNSYVYRPQDMKFARLTWLDRIKRFLGIINEI